MGTHTVAKVLELGATKEAFEAIALLVGRCGGAVVLPSVGVDRDAMDELHELMKPAEILVRLVAGPSIDKPGNYLEALVFEHREALRMIGNAKLVLR